MTLPVDEQIFGLKVSVSDVRAVQILEGEDDLDGEEKSYVVGESALATEQCEQLTTAGVVKQHEDVSRRLESALQVDDERVVDALEDRFLRLHMLDLL